MVLVGEREEQVVLDEVIQGQQGQTVAQASTTVTKVMNSEIGETGVFSKYIYYALFQQDCK